MIVENDSIFFSANKKDNASPQTREVVQALQEEQLFAFPCKRE